MVSPVKPSAPISVISRAMRSTASADIDCQPMKMSQPRIASRSRSSAVGSLKSEAPKCWSVQSCPVFSRSIGNAKRIAFARSSGAHDE